MTHARGGIAQRKEVLLVTAVADLTAIKKVLPSVSAPIIAGIDFRIPAALLRILLGPVMLDVGRGISLEFALAKTAFAMLGCAQSILYVGMP
jgi:hypothetical protein